MPDSGSPLDRMRLALGQCTFLPGSSHKRFARNVSGMPLDKITPKMWRHVIRLAWRYRRQMPRDLVPSKDAVEAMDRGPAANVAGIPLPVPERPRYPARPPDRPASPRRQPPSLPLFDGHTDG